MAQLEIKKMKQGMSYSCKEKTIILNVFKYFRNQYPEKCVTDIVRRTAKATGCSEKSVFQFRKEEASVEGFKEPSKTKIRKNININSRDIKYDNGVRTAIRNIIYDLQFKNIVPSLNTILKQVNNDKQLPNFSLMTLRRLMFDMGFSYQKNGNKSVLVEKPDTRFTAVDPPNDLQHKNNLQPLMPLPNLQDNMHLSNLNNKPQIQLPPDPRLDPRHPDLRLPPPDPRMPPDPRLPPIHKPVMNVPPQHNMMVPHSDMMHNSHMLHKPMMMNHRDMMPPPMDIRGPPMDIHRKREGPPMGPWMHGMIKQGQ